MPALQKADAVFEGGGVKGIGLNGALAAFEAAGWSWQNVAGTSAGAITAALVAVGYTAAEVRHIMDHEVEFRRFMDPAGIGRAPFIGPWLSLLFTNGMYQGDYFLKTMRRVLARKRGVLVAQQVKLAEAQGMSPAEIAVLSRQLSKGRITFRHLVLPKEPTDSDADYKSKYKYKLRLIASDVTNNRMLVLPQDVETLGLNPDNLEVARAVRMSMSIPFFFKPARVTRVRHAGGAASRKRHHHWIVDGGMLSNFPIWLFDSPKGQDPEWPTIGFLLEEPGSANPPDQAVRGPVTLAKALLRTAFSAHDRKALEEADLSRIVKIPTGRYSTVDFDLTDDDRKWLYDSGYQAAQKFLASGSLAKHAAQRKQAATQPRRI